MTDKVFTSRHERAHVEFFVRTVEEQRSEKSASGEVERILAELRSTDENIRARAVREICPCRMPMDVFFQLRKAAKQLQKDPSPLVGANAFHIEKDFDCVTRYEAQYDALQERDAEKRSVRKLRD